MKKKKPKKSPAKSSPKRTPPAKPSPSKPVKENLGNHSSLVVSDAQSGPSAGAVAQQSRGVVDLVPFTVGTSSDKTEIVPATDPSSAHEASLLVPESSLASPQSPSGIDLDESASKDVEAALPLQEILATTKSSSASPLSPSVIAMVEPAPTEDKAAHFSSLTLASADANGFLSSQLAIVAARPEVPKASIFPTSDVEVGATTGVAEPAQAEDHLESDNAAKAPSDTWCAHAKGIGKRLSKKGEAYTLPSGEACVRIPNSVIEKNRKSWEPFVIGQFYSDPPSQGTLHNIVNGIWSKHYRDIVVSKMESFSFLFRIPNAATRNRVINQKLWQIEGQTMFVDKWEPGVVPVKPELTSAPIWLELRKVPFQFFNEDGLERIAGLVGHPKFLHPSTANKTNLEVAKVFTVIDPRKPLPEAVNVQFDSGEICRVLVSSPWMPPVCDICKEIGHVSKRCPHLPKTCSHCNSSSHDLANCPKKTGPGRKTRRGRSKDKKDELGAGRNDQSVPAGSQRTQEQSAMGSQRIHHQPLAHKAAGPKSTLQWIPVDPVANNAAKSGSMQVEAVAKSKLGSAVDIVLGETSGTALFDLPAQKETSGTISRSDHSDVQPDSSDVESTDSELEEGEFSKHEPDFEVVRNRKRFSGQKGKRGRGPKIN